MFSSADWQELELQKKQQLARLGPRLSDGHAVADVMNDAVYFILFRSGVASQTSAL